MVSYEDMKAGRLNEHYLYFKFLSRAFAAPLAFSAYRMGISANQITALGILLCFPAAILNLWGYLGWGLVLFHLFYVLDTVDGVLARGANAKSTLGAYLDDLSHYIFHPVFLLTFSFCQFTLGFKRLSFLMVFFTMVSLMSRAHHDLVAKIRSKIAGEAGPKGKDGEEGFFQACKWVFIGSFDFPNVLVNMSVFFLFGTWYLEMYFAYASCFATLYYVYWIGKTINEFKRP